MHKSKSLLSDGLGRVLHNKRYLVWFYVLNLLLALFGSVGFVNQAGSILDHSLRADRLLHGFDIAAAVELFAQPEFGPTITSRLPAMLFALVFLAAMTLFLPGVLQGFASTYRLPREDFFRACGRNLWRFVRLSFIAAVVMIPLTAALFALHGVLEKKAAESTNELLLPEVRMAGLIAIFLVMTVVRIWFDLAQADVVLSDQRAVRKSLAAGFRHTFKNLGRLLGSYIMTTVVAGIILAAGLWVWMKLVPSASVGGAFVVSQITLFLLLIPRFWQRGIVVSYYLADMVEPIAVQPFAPVAVVAPVTVEPAPALIPAAPAGSPGA